MSLSADVRPLRVAFVHPDLGIGGAERLVVDAACGLQELGHAVHIYTSHWDPERCFQETRDGTLGVTVLGNSILPVSFRNRFHIVLAILRQLHLTLSLLCMTYFSSDFIPPDIYVVDQLSSCIPLLRWLARTRVIFYCHFPDLLLSPGRGGYASGQHGGDERRSFLRAIYRWPMDALEGSTTGLADRILLNSHFTTNIFRTTFPTIRKQLQIVYPGIRSDDYSGEAPSDDLVGTRPTLLSLNRYEPKKNVSLAIDAFASALQSGKISKDTRLLVAGGYDERVDGCIKTLQTLQRLSEKYKLAHSTTDLSAQVLFVTNLSEKQKLALLKSPTTKGLLYTPSFEHLGIVPLEAMACGLPVLAVNNGGPMETVVDGETGFLRPSRRADWGEAIVELLSLSEEKREWMGERGRKRVKDYFDVEVMGRSFDKAIRDVLVASETGQLPDVWVEEAIVKALLSSVLSVACVACIAVLVFTSSK